MTSNHVIADEKPKKFAPRSSGLLGAGRAFWLILYGLNIIVPAHLASNFVEGSSWFGVAGGVLLLGSLGAWVLSRYSITVWPAVVGAVVVGFSQFYPVLQLLTGSYAIALTRFFMGFNGTTTYEENLGVMASFLATNFTALECLAVSLIVGWVPFGLVNLVRKVISWRRRGLIV